MHIVRFQVFKDKLLRNFRNKCCIILIDLQRVVLCMSCYECCYCTWVLHKLLLVSHNTSVLCRQDGFYDGYYERNRFDESREIFDRRFPPLPPRDLGPSLRGRDFLPPPPLPPRPRDPLPPPPPLGLRGPSSSLRDSSSFDRGSSDYGIFSRRSPSASATPPNRFR